MDNRWYDPVMENLRAQKALIARRIAQGIEQARKGDARLFFVNEAGDPVEMASAADSLCGADRAAYPFYRCSEHSVDRGPDPACADPGRVSLSQKEKDSEVPLCAHQ